MPSLHKKKRKIPKAHHLTPPLTPEDAEMSDAEFAQTIDFYQLRDCFKEPVIVYTASAVVEAIAKGARPSAESPRCFCSICGGKSFQLRQIPYSKSDSFWFHHSSYGLY